MILFIIANTGCKKSVVKLLNQSSGTLASPYYPQNYLPNQRCQFWISVPQGMGIYLKFYNFGFDESVLPRSKQHFYTCAKATDFVEIRYGLSLSNHAIGKYCWGRNPPWAYQHRVENIIVSFVSDTYLTAAGFNASFTALYLNCKFCLCSNQSGLSGQELVLNCLTLSYTGGGA